MRDEETLAELAQAVQRALVSFQVMRRAIDKQLGEAGTGDTAEAVGATAGSRAAPPAAESTPAWKVNIDWMIGQRGACGKPDCFFFPVFVDLSKCNFTFRGPKSARECVNEAIRWTITKREEWEAWALNWLCAGQAHNPAARQEILKHSAECLAYISQMRPLD